jgi:peptide/nickel transport system substrate-binding protein
MKKLFYFLLCTLFAVTVLTGCGQQKSASSAAAGKHMNAALFWFGETMDPAHDWDGWTATRVGAGETLVTVTDKMQFEGQLADKWANVSPTVWKFHIRENVKFQNGDAMTPERVKASLERTLKENKRAAKSAKIKNITVDGQNLTVETTESYGSLLSSLTEPAFVIVDTQGDAKQLAETPVMTGPYMVTSFKKNEEIQLKANPDYWGGKPGLDSITVKNIKDNNKRAMALQSGDLDLVQNVDAANRKLFANDKYDIKEATGVRVYFMQLNFAGQLKDDNLRKALASAVDYESLAKVEGSGAIAAGAPFPPSADYGYQKAPRQQYDKDKAAQYLAAAGYTEKDNDGYLTKNGQELVLTFDVWGSRNSLYEAIQDQLKQAGIKVVLNRIQGPDENSDLGEYDMLENNWSTLSTNDPYWFMDQVFRSDSEQNVGHYSNPEADRLIKELAVTFDPGKRKEITEQVQKLVLQDNADIFLVFPANNVVMSKRVRNVPVFPIDYYLITKDVTIQ